MQRLTALTTSTFLLLHMLLGCCAHTAHAEAGPVDCGHRHGERGTRLPVLDDDQHAACPPDPVPHDDEHRHTDCRGGCVFMKSESRPWRLSDGSPLVALLPPAVADLLSAGVENNCHRISLYRCGKVPPSARPLVLRC